MSDQPKSTDQLSPQEKRALLAQLLQKKVVQATQALTYGQKAFWFLYEMERQSVANNYSFSARIRSPLNIPLLNRCFQALVDRHASLRTTYMVEEGTPAQRVRSRMDVHFRVVDASEWSEEVLSDRVTAEARQPFRLETDAPMRAHLFTLAQNHAVLLLTFHHIAVDYWSVVVLLDELSKLYEAEIAGVPVSLPALPLQYTDFANWQAKRLSGARGEELWAYWQKQLSGSSTVLNLPTDRPRPAVQTYAGASHVFKIGEELVRGLKDLAADQGVTLYQLLLAAFQLLLHRYSDQPDVLICSPASGRDHPDFGGIVGYFANPVVLRGNLEGNPPFSAFLGQVRQTVLSALEYQEFPFPLLVERMQVARDPSCSPLVQVSFALEKSHRPELRGISLLMMGQKDARLELGGLVMESFPFKHLASPFDLQLIMEETGGAFYACFQYNTDLFDRATVARMVGNFERLLASIVVNPNQRVDELPLLTEAEQRLLVEWNGASQEYPRDRSIHALYEEQAERTPDAVAVVFGAEELTYRELNGRANRLANRLRALGIGPSDLVGLCVERSIEMIVGTLAIVKAGGAYVPLDPEYPQERLAFMLADTGVPVLLTQEHLVSVLPPHSATVICLDAAEEGDECNPPVTAGPEDLAYVMYTSGSTGTPKGVAVPHRGVVRLVKSTNYARLTADEVFLQLAPISFDAATLEIWGALLNGARVVVMPPGTPTLVEIGEALRRHGVTILWLTAGLFHLMVDERLQDLRPVRQLLAGGDVLSVPHVQRVLRELPECQLINGYGPTENTTFTCCYTVTGEVTGSVPIGRPVAHTQVYILDAHMQPVPIGVSGELYIGGDGLAQGYLNRPELTAEKFVASPFEPGARLYRTGDLVRYLPDGNIEFLGRMDSQVKIRGFRIELGEVEAVLSEHPAVREAVVLVRQDIPGTSKRLVAYVVPAEGQTLSASDVRTNLKARLPEYMVPSAVVFLDAMPLDANGKVDRKALPAPEHVSLESERPYEAPRTPDEEALAAIWKQVLRIDQVSIHDNYFELGGDSILSIQISARAAQAGLMITPKQLFQYQTIAELASVAKTTATVLAEQGPVTGPVALTPIQHWFFEQEIPERHHWNQAVMVELRQPVDPAVLEKALQHLAVHHDTLRLRYEQTTEGWQQRNGGLEETDVRLTRVDLSGVPEQDRAAAVERAAGEAQATLNLFAGPLLRAVLFDRGPGLARRLLVVIHHMAVDGVSWRIVLEDLQTACEQLGRGEAVQLPPKTTSFQQWARQLTAYAQSDAVRAELDYWLNSNENGTGTLPVDYPEGQNTEASVRQVTVSLSAEETRALLHDVPAAYRTQINDVLLAALAEAAGAWTGERRLLVDLEGHGREEVVDGVDLSRTVGWFTTIYPVQLDASTAGGPGTVLKGVKEKLRAMRDHGIGFGMLRYLHQDEAVAARLRALPQAEVSFNYLGQFDQAFADGLFAYVTDPVGPIHGPSGMRSHRLDITGMVVDGQLQILFLYSDHLHRLETVEAMAQQYREALQALIAHCLSPEAGGYTPSDFPLAKLTQEQIDRLLPAPQRIADVYPLSPTQKGMLFHALYDPESRAYFLQMSCVLRGELDVVAFRQAWQRLVDRHAILRTAFVWEGVEEPLQVVCREVVLTIEAQDWSDLSEAEQADRLETVLQADKERGFTLSEAPLLRLALLKLGDNRHQFVFSLHHIVTDGWSMPLLLKEMFVLYEAYRRGEEAALGEARPYRDYIGWLQRQNLSAAEPFWRQLLEGFTAPTALSVERASGVVTQGSGYGEQDLQLPAKLTASLQALARHHQLTLNTLVQGAWAMLLSRYSGEEDVLFGATVSGRPADLAGVESMVGLFINTMPVRVRVPRSASLLPWLQELQRLQVEMRQYEYTPLVTVQGWSDVPRGTALFDSIVVFENYPIDSSARTLAGNLTMENVRKFEFTNYPITLIAVPHGSALSLQVGYDGARFDRSTMSRMLGHLWTLLEGIVANPEQQIGRLSILSEAEHQQLLREWNDTSVAYRQDICLHQLVEEQVERTPEAIAVVYENQRLTYRELNRRANQLAHFLRGLGVGPEVMVGIFTERSTEMVVGLLAILKAGGAYVPLDPSYPKDRLAFMLADSRVPVLLTQHGQLAELPEHEARVICMDTDWDAVALEPDHNPESGVTAENLAYVIYTSGSTGQPKGVMVNHANVARLFSATEAWFHFNEQDVWTLFHSYAFDFSVWELWGALCYGGRVVVVPYWVSRSPEAFYDLLCAEQVTVLNQTPSAFRQLIHAEELAGEGNLALRLVIFGGEALELQSLRPWFQRHGDQHPQLVNMYGITETTVHVTYRPLCLDDLDEAPGSVVGGPIPDLQVYVLDGDGQLAPIGVPGEMYVGGAGLARGYLNRPELTSERFIANPFSSDPAARLYRSGDLVRRHGNGDIEYLGRIDHQVKIRGFRIELGEIESVLSQHPTIRETVVLAREFGAGDKRLVAYVVPNGEQAPTSSELREYLKAKLPEYMVPASFVVLDAMPLTSNGKLDRKALPVPEQAFGAAERDYVAPRTPDEEALAAIWKQVLRVERVGIHDNFFELGGDSILSIQIVSRAHQAGLQITPKQLFQHQTVAELAAVARTTMAVQAEQGPVTGPVALTPIERWFFEQEIPERHHWNQAVAVELRQPVDPAVIEKALQHLVVHHDALRLRFEQTVEGWQQVNAGPTEGVTLARFDLSALPEQEQAAAIERAAGEAQASLNLSEGPLLRAVLFDRGPGLGERLLLVIHHLAVDGVSWRIVLEDLQTACEQLGRGEAVQLPPKTTSFQEWAWQLTEYAQSDAVRSELDYWTETCEVGTGRLPVDNLAGENTEASMRQVTVSLSAEETSALLHDVPAAYRTQINDVLLAALAEAAVAWTGEHKLLLDLEGHGREEVVDGVDLSRTVGWFTTIYPVWLDVPATGGAGATLKAVKEQLRAMRNHGIGFGLLRYLHQDEAVAARLRALPQAEVSFNYLGQFDQAFGDSKLLAVAHEPIGPAHSPEARRPYLLDISGMVADGRLQVVFAYSENLHRYETVEAMAQQYREALRALVAHCLSPEAGGCTPSDFPLARLTQEQIDRLLPTPRRIEDVYPLSALQQGILFHTLYAPQSGVYFQQVTCEMQGGLDVVAFQRAWQHVVEQHPALRTAFVWEGVEEPLQVVCRGVTLPIEEQDWSGFSEAEQTDRLEASLRADQERGFTLSEAPLMRLALFRLSQDRYRFVWSHHHLQLDGWSLPLVFRDIFAAYEAYRHSENVELGRVRPYRDYIAWLEQQSLSEAEPFWREMLRGFTAPTPLGEDKAGGMSQEPGLMAEQELVLPAELAAALQALARQHQLTFNTLVQGAWALLLNRYSGEEDVLFGATVSGRPADLAGVESMVGLFINTLPFRVQVPDTERLVPWLQELQRRQAEMRQYEFTPLVRVHGWSDVPRGVPLFESIVVFENYPINDASQNLVSGLGIDSIRTLERTNFPLSLFAIPYGAQWMLRISYNRNRFGTDAVARMLGHLQMLLHDMVANPAQPLADLSLLTAAERQRMLMVWNDTCVDYRQDICVHQLVEEQVERTPDAPAVVFGDEQLTYRELNSRANQVARHLRRMGVGPHVLVGLCVQRSSAMLIGLLGVLKAGGAYVPMDPSFPRERLHYMMEDAGVAVLLTERRLGDLLEHQVPVVHLDSDWEQIAQEETANVHSNVTPEDLAYLIYTSGSTGRPKGVEIPHGAVVNFLHAMRDEPGLTGDDTLLAVTTLSFDIAVLELLLPLTVGARVALVSHEVATDGVQLQRAIIKTGASVMQATPATWRMLIDAGWSGPSGLKVLCGGEALPRDLAAELTARGASVWNMYGPTETTIWSAVDKVSLESMGDVSAPIGRPIANTQFYVLDSRLQPVPVGVVGELCIGGAGLARGYRNRPDLTAERFISDPFSPDVHAKMYRTGDRVLYRPDGRVEFLGRMDHQVKVRGFRIELGEIEAALGQHPAIRETVVVAREFGAGDKRLVAYLVPNGEQVPPGSDLREYLKAKLPEYMVPSSFVFLEAMPLSPNGKVDRRALPAPEPSLMESSYVEPRTLAEVTLTGIWAEVLGLKRVGIHDNFFDVGGHSLLATRLIARVNKAFEAELPLRSLFEYPTVAGLASRIEASQPTTQAPALVRGARESAPPLSFTQQRMWFLEQLEPGGSTYNIPLGMRLRGSLHVEALERSLTEIQRRHETLRTTFVMVETDLIQLIAPPSPVSLRRVDLSAMPEPEWEVLVQQSVAEDARRPFDLANGPLWRSTLLKLHETEHVLLISLHHIIADGWSMNLLAQELAAHYRAYATGTEPSLPELPVQYADFAVWQRQWLQGDALAEQLAYWRQQFAGSTDLLGLPTDKPRPPVQTFNGAVQMFTLPQELSDRLRALSRQEDVTLYMTLLAAFKVVLHRYSGREEITVGSPIANRNRVEIEDLIGCFINTLALRTDLSGNPSFRALLKRVREVTLGAYAHQDLPFELLVNALQPERSLSHSPLFQVVFSLQTITASGTELPGLTVEPLPVDWATAKFDLTLVMSESAQGLEGSLEYNTDLFEPATVSRMIGHLQSLLKGIVADADQPVATLPLLTAAEQDQILVEWNDTAKLYPQGRCVHELIAERAEQTPDAVAVEFEGQRLTYAALNAQANQCAHYLRRLGVGPEVLVGICVERSLAMLVGVLGVLKAGGAYVPVDPTYPKDRIAFMLQDSQVPVLLTQESLLPDLPEHGARVVCLDADWGEIAQESDASPDSGVRPENLAYVIYTSGSTGRPKGAQVTHDGLCNFAVTQSEVFGFHARSRTLQFASLTFDASVWDIFLTLVQGGTLVLARKAEVRDPETLTVLLERERITVLLMPPSLLGQLALDTGSYLETVVAGGEVLPTALAAAWASRIGLWDAYGPTEVTWGNTAWKIPPEIDLSKPVAVGYSLPNYQMYVLDRHLQPVPVGVPGEIYIGGAGVGRGYLNRPDLTADRYIPDPFRGKPGARLYKTGDLGRWLAGGNLDFLGRLDDQVKIRGFRIELGELEVLLAQHPAVEEAVVVAREDVPGDKRLVAYIVSTGEQELEAAELRGFLKERVPEFMVPSAVMVLERFPLTPNGKVDRKALPAPEKLLSRLDNYQAPRTPVEKILTGIWSEVLRIDQVGIRDSFFELGGHSLLATQLVSRVRTAFHIELPLRSLFEHPTVETLAAQVEAAVRAGGQVQVPLIPAVRETEELGLSYAQQRLWFLDQLEPGSALYNVPAAIRLRGPLETAALQRSLDAIVRRHESLRTSFPVADGQPVQVIAPPFDLPLSVVDLQGYLEAGREAESLRLAREEARRPFDLASGPVVRSTLLRLGPEDHVLLLTMHHIVSDGWSVGLLVRELGALYDAMVSERPSPLAPLPIQYADFAQWQRQWLQGEVLESQLAYWKEQMGGALSVLELPTDRPRPAVQTYRGAIEQTVLPQELGEALKELSRQEGATLFMTLLAAFQTLLYRYSGQTDVTVGTPVANRNHRETEGLIGFFMNTVALRTNLSGNPRFRELVRRVREVALGAYAHQDVPFEKLVEALQPERNLSRSPLFQVMMILQNTPMQSLALPGVELEILEVENHTAKFDLTLSLAESAQGLNVMAEYNTDLFEAATMKRLLGHYQVLLEAIVTNPEQEIGRLPLLTEVERRQALYEWNDTSVAYRQDICLHQLVEEQVERTPDAIAVVYENQRLTYRELNRRANQLAHHLRRLGVGPEVRVGICAERSVELVVGLLGILKAGGAYVPIDPSYPAERLTYMLADSSVPVLLTQQRLAAELPEHGARVIGLDTDWSEIGVELLDNPVCETGALNTAYMIYTSGSTGKPKGVMVPHVGIVNRLLWMQDEYQLTAADRVMQKTPFSFDVSVWEFFWPLLAGAILVVAQPGGHQDSRYLTELIREQRMTTMHFVPSMLQVFVEEPEFGLCDSLRQVMCSGEALPLELVKRFYERAPHGVKLNNLYGPTEASVDVTYWECPTEGERSVPIGRPVANTQMYVMDERLEPVPMGVAGELLIGGVQLARGYLNRPELTAEKFIPDPYGGQVGARLYRTGDLARYREDGAIEYLGRMDHQVKIRGFRIELGEIEAALGQHPAIRETVVVAREFGAGDKRLVAYLVPNGEQAPPDIDLREYLKVKLPEYMVPSSFIFLEAMPLSPNGKVDRKAMPTPEEDPASIGYVFVPPRDVWELHLAQIWEELLQKQPIGVKDNFFDLGGHSLLAVRMMRQIETWCGFRLPLAALFQGPTIEHIADLVRGERRAVQGSPLVGIQPGGTRRPFFCVHPAGGSAMQYVDLARELGTDQPFYGLQAPWLDGTQEPHDTIEAMAGCYVEAIRTIQPEGPYLLGGWSLGGQIALDMARQLQQEGQEVALLALFDTRLRIRDDARRWMDETTILLDLFAGTLSLDEDQLRQMDDNERVIFLLAEAKRVGAVPPDFELIQFRLYLHGRKAVVLADQNYAAAPYAGPMAYFQAQDAWAEGSGSPAQQWESVAQGPLEIFITPGTHQTMVQVPHVQTLAALLYECLGKAHKR